MAKLCNAAPAFFRAQPRGTGRNFTQPIVTRPLQRLLCRMARASFRLKSVIVASAKQVLTGPGTIVVLRCHAVPYTLWPGARYIHHSGKYSRRALRQHDLV